MPSDGGDDGRRAAEARERYHTGSRHYYPGARIGCFLPLIDCFLPLAKTHRC